MATDRNQFVRGKHLETAKLKERVRELSTENFNTAQSALNLTLLLAALVKQHSEASEETTDEKLREFIRRLDSMEEGDARLEALKGLLILCGYNGGLLEVRHDDLLSFDGFHVSLQVGGNAEKRVQVLTASKEHMTETAKKLIAAPTPDEISLVENAQPLTPTKQ